MDSSSRDGLKFDLQYRKFRALYAAQLMAARVVNILIL